MKRIVLGTAGHIDHGKTLLTKALTGVDTDRLAEEKDRGISIELGFAPYFLADGSQISIVDVPGHEKFVRTMMAGVSGIDGVLLIVAADDGVMPQTREHFDILCLLGIRAGIVVITKTDLVDDKRINDVRSQILELTKDSFLENAPVCPVSAVTGEGIDELRRCIEGFVGNAAERSTERPFRLPVDRMFPVAGFGNVVTGTVTEGSIRTGETVEITPVNARGNVRTLQTHGADVREISAGMRAAISFSALSKDVLQRGCTVAESDSVIMTDLLTAQIQILSDCPYEIRNSSQLHLFHGTQEQVCRIRLLDRDSLHAGERGFAQLKLAQPIPVRWNDRFILRFFSPVVTVGGGTIIDCGGKRLRRGQDAVLDRLRNLADQDLTVQLLQRVNDADVVPVSAEKLRRYGNLASDEYRSAEAFLKRNGAVFEASAGFLLGTKAEETRLMQAKELLARFHEEYPLQNGMEPALLRSRLFPESNSPADVFLRRWTESGHLKNADGKIALIGFEPVFTREHKIMQRRLLHFYREAWFHAPDLKTADARFERFGKLYRQVLDNMRMNGMLIPLSPRYWVHKEAFEDALRIFSELAEKNGSVTLAEFRTAAEISRKYSQLFLEYWDRRGITRRIDDTHVLMQNDIKNSSD